MIHRSASDLEDLRNHTWDPKEIDRRWRAAVAELHRIYSKILVLDDDPTGSQTVYDLPVYTHFDVDDLLSARRDDAHTVYVLTNSRSLHEDESEELHRTLMRNWMRAGRTSDGETFVEEIDEEASECRPTGCSGQVCADEDIITTCEYLPEYACYENAVCERQPDGECGWTMTDELINCLAQYEEE